MTPDITGKALLTVSLSLLCLSCAKELPELPADPLPGTLAIDNSTEAERRKRRGLMTVSSPSTQAGANAPLNTTERLPAPIVVDLSSIRRETSANQ